MFDDSWDPLKFANWKGIGMLRQRRRMWTVVLGVVLDVGDVGITGSCFGTAVTVEFRLSSVCWESNGLERSIFFW